MTDIEHYRELALQELRQALNGAPENGAADQAVDAAIRKAKGLPVRPIGTDPYVRLFPAPPQPVPMTALGALVGAKAGAWSEPLNKALREAYITDALEVAHFLAQVATFTETEPWDPFEQRVRRV